MTASEPPAPVVLPPKLSRVDLVLGVITGVLLFGVLGLLLYTQVGQMEQYRHLLGNPNSGAGALAFARAADAATVKTCSIFLAFALIFLGALFTFRAASMPFQLGAEGAGGKGTLETASPGLVMMTLGVFLAGSTVWKEYTISLDSSMATPTTGMTPSQTISDAKVITSSAAPPSGAEPTYGGDAMAAINTAVALLDAQRANLTDPEGATWTATRPRLDQLRRTMAFRIYPQIRQRYDALSSQYRADPKSLEALKPEDRDAFEAVQRLLTAQIEGVK